MEVTDLPATFEILNIDELALVHPVQRLLGDTQNAANLGWDSIALWAVLLTSVAVLVIAAVRLGALRRSLERQRCETMVREDLFVRALSISFDSVYRLEACRDASGAITDFVFRDVSPTGAQLIKMAREELIGRRVGEVLPMTRSDGLIDRYIRVVETGERLEEEFTSNVEAVRAHVLQHQIDKVGDGVIIVTRDVTEAKASREALIHAERANAVSQLAGSVVHDFRNLLLAIRANAALAASECPSDHPAQRNLALIEEAVEQGNDVTETLSHFTRRGPAKQEIFDISSVVNRSSDLARKLLPSSITITCIPGGPEWYTLGSADALKQILIHLVLSARDSIQGDGTLRIETTQRNDGTEGMRYCIALTSSRAGGIPAATARMPSAGTTSMALKAMIEDLGGTLEVEQPGEGESCTRILVDAASAPKQEPGSTPSQLPKGGVAVVIEGDPLLRSMFGAMFTQLGYTVQTCATTDRLTELMSSGIRPKVLAFQQRARTNTLDALQPIIDALDADALLLVVAESDATVPESDRVVVVRKPFRRDDLARALAAGAARQLTQPARVPRI